MHIILDVPTTLSHGCGLLFSHRYSKLSVSLQGHQENNKSVLLIDYQRQDTCTCYLSIGATINIIRVAVYRPQL